MGERILVVGGTRSGKSSAAEALAAAHPAVVYVATGPGTDAEMAERAAAHRARRPAHWRTIEDADVAAALAAAPDEAAVLVDALTGWIAARMSAHELWPAPEAAVTPLGACGRAALAALVDEALAWWQAAAARAGPIIVVADEAGWGPTPAEPAARRWLDVAGPVTNALSGRAERVLLAVAGRLLDLPATGPSGTPPASTADRDGADAAGTGGTVSAERAGRAQPAGPATAGGSVRAERAGRTQPAGATEADGTVWGDAAEPSAAQSDLRRHGDTMVAAGELDLAVNVERRAPPPAVAAAVAEAAAAPQDYPDPAAAQHAAATRHGRSPEEVLVTAGAAEGLWAVAAALRPQRAVCVHPAFTEPEAALRAHGAPVRRVLREAAEGWALDPCAVPEDADLVVVGNPNNPTGTLDDPERIAALCRPGRITLVDEAFIDFVADEAAWSLAGAAWLPGLVVARSVTKLWGLAGLRAGYLLGPAALLERCAAMRQPWSVSAPALAALRACLADEDGHRARVAAEVAEARAELVGALGRLPGVTVWDGAANFLLLCVPDGAAVTAALAARGIAVRRSTFPGLDRDHLRIAVRDAETNRHFVETLAAVLAAGARR